MTIIYSSDTDVRQFVLKNDSSENTKLNSLKTISEKQLLSFISVFHVFHMYWPTCLQLSNALHTEIQVKLIQTTAELYDTLPFSPVQMWLL